MRRWISGGSWVRSLDRERRRRGAVGMSAGKGGISLMLFMFVLFVVWFLSEMVGRFCCVRVVGLYINH